MLKWIISHYADNFYSDHDIEMIKLGILQKFAGIFFLFVGFLPLLLDKDITLLLLFVPIGLFLVFTKKCYIFDKGGF